MDHFDILDRHAQLIADQLRKCRLMTLSMGVCAGKDLHIACRVKAHLRTFPQTNSGTQLTHRRRGRNTAGFDVGRKTNATQFASRLGFFGPCRKPAVVSQFHGLVQRRRIVSAVVALNDRSLIGKRINGYEITPANFCRIQPHICRTNINQTLHQIGGFRSAGTAAGINRCCVGKYRFDLRVNQRSRVLPGQQESVQVAGHHGAESRQIRTQIGLRLHPHRQKFAVFVHRHFRSRYMITTVRVCQKSLGSIAVPLHGTLDFPAGPADHQFLCIDEDLGAEPAAHIRPDHTQFVFRGQLIERRQHQSVNVRILSCQMKGDLVRTRVVLAQCRSGLHGIGNHAIVNQIQLGHLVCTCECRLYPVLIPEWPVVTDVIRGDLMDLRLPGVCCATGIDHGRQDVVIHIHQLSRITSLSARFSNDDRDMIPDIIDFALSQRGMSRRPMGLSVITGHRHTTDQGADAVSCQIVPGQHCDNTGRGKRIATVDSFYLCVRMGRAHEYRMGLTCDINVIGVVAFTDQKTLILLPAHTCANAVLIHFRTLPWLLRRPVRLSQYCDIPYTGKCCLPILCVR